MANDGACPPFCMEIFAENAQSKCRVTSQESQTFGCLVFLLDDWRKQSVKDEKKTLGELKTTGQLRTMLANAAKAVMQGSLDIERANALHKIAKNISDSLYSETKIAMFRNEVGQTIEKFGDLPLGSTDD